MNLKKIDFIKILLYLFVFFPYIKFPGINTDTQPYAFIISCSIVFFYVFIRRVKLPKKVVLLFIVANVSFLLGIINLFSYDALRSIFGYLSVFIISLATYFTFKNNIGLDKNLIKFIVIVWGVIGFIQTIFDKNFMTDLISRTNATSNRGVNALAPEPTYYGTMMYFLLFIVILFFDKNDKKNIYISICILQIVLFAKSAMILLILLLLCIIFCVELICKKLSIEKKVITIGIFNILFFIFKYIISLPLKWRMIVAIRRIYENPIEFFKTDASSNDRLSAIYFSFKGAADNFLLPNGFERFSDYVSIVKASNSFFWYGNAQRIMCMYGAIVYELGIIGIIIPIMINIYLWKLLKNKGMKQFRLTLMFFINFIFMTAVPLSSPFVGFLLGILLFESSRLRKRRIFNVKKCISNRNYRSGWFIFG